MKELFKALAAFQQEVPIIHKGTEGYGYSYADLPAIFEVINPLLKVYKLGFTQLVNENVLTTIVFHTETGEKIESNTELIKGVSLAKMNDFQVLGSQITYLRRYALSSLLGLVTDVDNDASGEQKKETKKDDTIWLTESQYNTALKSDAKGIQATLNAFSASGRSMKKQYREALKAKLLELNK
jgi:hypothetical protein